LPKRETGQSFFASDPMLTHPHHSLLILLYTNS